MVKIGLDSSQFDKGIAGATSKSKGLGSAMKIAGKAVAVGAAAVTAAGAALLAMANKAGAAADEIDKMSIRTGISREQLQELRFAASQTGVSFSAIETASARITTTLRTNEKAFKGLGVATRGANGEMRRSDDIFNESIRALAAMDNEVERNILGQELFGRGFTEMIPLIDAGADGIDDYAARAHELGVVLNDDAIEANVAFMDSMDEIKSALQGAFQQTMTAILPLLQRFLDWVLANMPTIQAMIGGVMGFISEVVENVFAVFEKYLLPVMVSMYDWVQENFPAIRDAVVETFETIMQAISEKLIPVFESIVEWYQENLPDMEKQFSERFETIKNLIELFVDAVTWVWDKFGETFMKVIWETMKFIWHTVDDYLDIVYGVIDFFIGLFRGDWEAMTEALEQIWEGFWSIIRRVVETAWTLLRTAFGTLWNNIRDWFSGLATSAREWGAGMIQGFIDGILDMVEGVRKAASSVVSAASSIFSGGKAAPGPQAFEDGSTWTPHALGLNNVPYDGYKAILHKGERVMTAAENRTGGGDSTVVVQNMHVRNDSDIRSVARELYALQRREIRGGGFA